MAQKVQLRAIGTTRDLAKARGVSVRTARRMAVDMPGAYRTGKGWRIPLTTREYATARDVSVRTAQRRALRLRNVTVRDILRKEREQRDLTAYNWFKEGGKQVLPKEQHNPRPLPGKEGFAYTIVARIPPDIHVSRTFIFRRRMTPAGLRKHRRVRRWVRKLAQRYDVNINEIVFSLRGAYRHGPDVYDATATYS